MSILPDETGLNVKYIWLGFLEVLYSLTGFQRLLILGGIVAIAPSFFLVRFTTGYIYSKYYDSKTAYATTAFSSVLDLQVGDFSVIPSAGGYTAFVELVNPNFELSASKVNYVASFFDDTGRKVAEKTGETWLEPSGRQTVVIPRFTSDAKITRASMTFAGIKWQKKIDYPRVELSVVDPVVFAVPGGGVRLEGQVMNKSPYSIAYARVLLFVYNRDSQVIGAVERYEFNLAAGERRAYVLNFNEFNPLEVYRVEARVSTNVFDAANVTTVTRGGVEPGAR